MSREEFINSLNLPFEGKERGNEYVISLDNSDDFSLLYDEISNNNFLTLDNNSITTPNNAYFLFYNDEYDIKLIADFGRDIYKLVIGDR